MEYLGRSKLFKAIALTIASLVIFAGVAVVAPKVAKAETVEELQAQIQALLQQIAQLQAQLAALEGGEEVTPEGSSLYCYEFTRNLTIGMRGDDVRALQEILIAEGTWTRPDIGATGYFGPITKASLIAFQDKYAEQILHPLGLTKGTGYFGPSTRSYISSRCTPTPPTPVTEGPEIENAVPEDGATDVEKDTDISFDVTDPDGVDLDSLEVTVNDEDVTENCVTSEITDGYEVVCDVEEFEAGEEVEVSVYVEDEEGNSTEESWSFTVKEEEVTGISVSLAEDTPASANLPNNASNVPFLKVKFTGKGTIDEIIITRVGAGDTGDFDYIYLYDGETKLTTGRSLNSSTHQARFTNLNLEIDGEKVITVVADLSGTGGNVDALELTSVSVDVEVSGLPIRGNEMALTSVTAGEVTIERGAQPDNPKVGQQNAKLSEFKLTADSTEDIQVERIALYQGGSVSRSDLTNLELKVGGEVVATAEGINDQDQAVFVFDTPYEIEKGNTRIFEVYGDVGSGTKPNETIKFYLDEDTDLKAIGQRYGYGVSVENNNFDSSNAYTLQIQGGQVTISFNGPASTEIAAGGKDVTLMEITISSQNDIEIRKVSTTVTLVTGTASDNEYTDCKWVDADTGEVLTSSWDLSDTSSGEFNDIWTVDGGSSRNLKFTCDIASTADSGDQLKVSVNFADSNYIKNLENNQWVSTSDIVPSSAITGNTMTVATPSLTLSTAGTPTDQTYVVGATEAELVGISLRAGDASDIKVTSIKATFSVSSGNFDASDDILRIALFDGDERVSDWESVTNASTDYVTFDNLSVTIPAGQTKILVAKADIQASASTGTVSMNVSSSDISAQDEESNSVDPTGSVTGPTITIASGGTVTIARAPDDTETREGLVVAGDEVVLAKFRFTAQDEDLELKKIKIGVVDTYGSTTSDNTADEVSMLKLYDGSTLLAEQPLDSSTGLATFTGLSGFVVPKDSSKVLTVKAQLNSISEGSEGADSGTSLYAFLSRESGFEMLGQNTITTFSTSTGCVGTKGCYGNRKVVYKTVPTIEVADAEETLLSAGEEPLMKFTVTADDAENVSIKRIALQISVNNATVSLDELGDIAIKDLTNNVWYRYEDSNLSHTTTSNISSGSTTTIITFTDEGGVTIAAGSSVTFQVYINVDTVGTNSASVQGKLVLATGEDTNPAKGTVDALDDNYYFIWSDNSVLDHSDSSSDWINGYKVEGLPTPAKTISKS